MNGHTKGQWVAEFDTVGNGGWREPDDVATIYCGEKIIATYSVSYGEYPESRDENEANARLIAAAPDLLGALSGLLSVYSEPDRAMCCDGRECGCMGASVYQEAEHYARAAIARATQGAPTNGK